MKLLIEEEVTDAFLVIRHTTSKKCKIEELTTVETEEGDFMPLKLQFGKRSCCNKCFWIQYKCLRVFYVSVYFYFMPFFCIMLSCLIPLLGSLDDIS